jgi:nitrogenase molybdenum-iron protein alpha/beta subunit
MRERDVVFGAESNLKKMILSTNRRLSPAAFFVITSCPSGIIGEDFDRNSQGDFEKKSSEKIPSSVNIDGPIIFSLQLRKRCY